MKPTIRPAKEADSAEIARLAGQLGYPANAEQIQTRLRRLLASANDVVLVAESSPGGLSGWIHGFLCQLIESDFRVEIGGLVVDQQCHRNGIGRALVSQVEQWAKQRHVTESSVRCRTTRKDAHLFYERLGYAPAKEQIVFRKALVN